MSRTHVYWILLATFSSVINASLDKFFINVNLRRIQDGLTLQNFLTVYSDSYDAKSSKTSCRDEMLQFKMAIESGQTWAMHMLDSSSKIPSGILVGNVMDIGMYDQCVGVHPQENVTEIQGRHCLYTLNVPLSTILPYQFNSSLRDSKSEGNTSNPSIRLTLSACLPSSCENEDVQQIMNDAIEQLPNLKETGVTVGEVFCSRKGNHTWGSVEVIMMIILLAFVLFLVLCTICEFIKDIVQFQSIEALSRFSLYANARTLLRTTAPKNFPVLNGLRFISSVFVLIGHTLVFSVVSPITNVVGFLNAIDTPGLRFLNLSFLSVETFFVISGFLMSYTFLRNMRQGATFNLITYYIHRYMRITPFVALFLLFSMWLGKHSGSGALFDLMIGSSIKNCKANWWLSLLHVQNFLGLYGCAQHLWYLAVDMQLFWLSPIILYPLHRWPRVGLRILALFLIASIVTPIALGVFNGYSILFVRPDKSFLENNVEFQNKYMYMHVRAAPWLIGVYLGYLLVDKKRQVTRVQMVVGWFLTIVSFMYHLFVYRHTQVKNYEYNVLLESLNTLILRPTFGASIAWIIFASEHGYGGPIAKFLSLPVFVPLGRLSFSTYLLHAPLQYLRVASAKSSSYFFFNELFQFFCADLVMSTVAAFFFSLLFEMPISILIDMVIGKKDHSKHPQIEKKVQ